jgi:hypothetical protein
VNSAALQLALTEPTMPELRPLPDAVARLLTEVDAPPRLAAHLRAVHDVAWQLTAAVNRGYPTLLSHGVEASLARFARNHGTWIAPGISTEDLLVSLADKIWKAKRVSDLEDRLVQRLCEATGAPRWQAFMHLDGILEQIAQDADARLAFQARHPVAMG